ncbi:HesA/MoeB/ThiF family protein [Shewanella violacea]|uniref:ThiF protein, putative n=1 Tax=Shewanella violacea (strain JCM 10179 / CIP 106290 / LMG 19151 / DSS12) TaxID=637905 RepID=D4ZKZ1_SHEVD|nr:HesA/MoeB/ThiF family protein [Shewanella violacea]BAJ02340.1 thiF protein, putative [Shewanella violacea DSS12]
MSLSNSEFLRYSRQILLPDVGEIGQINLLQAHVAIVGIGGLGHLVAQYLAAAGVGHLTLIDDDKIELSNLPRQLLFSDKDIGEYKSKTAAHKLSNAYSACDLHAVTDKLAEHNRLDLLEHMDLVFDCTDDFSTRHLINLTCLQAKVPLITASVANFNGQLFMLDMESCPDSGCYACLFPEDSLVSQTCQSIGVLGPMVGVMASMQALLGMNILLGVPVPQGRLFRFDGRAMQWRESALSRDSDCHVCGGLMAQSRTESQIPDLTVISSGANQ